MDLPKRELPIHLGKSRNTALKRFLQNERSLKAKGHWEPFSQGVQEYLDLKHAEMIPLHQLTPEPSGSFYLPMHGMTEESSTTTKLRIVFDGSAKTSSGKSLNDSLLPGPSLYPLLSSVIDKFRLHTIGISGDISKMFREVALLPK